MILFGSMIFRNLVCIGTANSKNSDKIVFDKADGYNQ